MNHVTRQAGRMFRYLNTLHILYKISLLYVLLSVKLFYVTIVYNFMKRGSSDFSCWQLFSLSRNFSFLMQPEDSIPYSQNQPQDSILSHFKPIDFGCTLLFKYYFYIAFFCFMPRSTSDLFPIGFLSAIL